MKQIVIAAAMCVCPLAASAEPSVSIQRTIDIFYATDGYCEYQPDDLPESFTGAACRLGIDASHHLFSSGCRFDDHEHMWHCPDDPG